MEKEFILGKKYLCTNGSQPVFIVGNTYEAYSPNGRDIFLLSDPYLGSYLCRMRWHEFAVCVFEEVKDEDNTIKVGDKVLTKGKNQYEVLALHDHQAWIVGSRGVAITYVTACLSKVKDIRTIECAGGAVRITGEYMLTLADGRVRVEIPEKFAGYSIYSGTEVS